MGGFSAIRILTCVDIIFAVVVIAHQSYYTATSFPLNVDNGSSHNNFSSIHNVTFGSDKNSLYSGLPFGLVFILFMLVVLLEEGSILASLAVIITTKKPIRLKDACTAFGVWLIYDVVTVLAALSVWAAGFRVPMIESQCFIYITVRLILAILLARNFFNLLSSSTITFVDPNYRTWEEKLNDFLESEGLKDQTCSCPDCTATIIQHLKIEERIMNVVLGITD